MDSVFLNDISRLDVWDLRPFWIATDGSQLISLATHSYQLFSLGTGGANVTQISSCNHSFRFHLHSWTAQCVARARLVAKLAVCHFPGMYNAVSAPTQQRAIVRAQLEAPDSSKRL